MQRFTYLLLFALIYSGCNQNKLNKPKVINYPTNLTSADLKIGNKEIPMTEEYKYWEQNEQKIMEFHYILNLDVMKYYSLEEKYSTPLQKKNFSESEEYQEKLDNLKERKQNLTSDTYFIDWKPKDYLEFEEVLEYDLYNKTFTIRKGAVKNSKYTQENRYLHFSHLAFETPANFSKKLNQDVWRNPNTPSTLQDISFRVSDETTALKIEENNEDIRMIFTFNIQSSDASLINEILECKLQKVALYNQKTREVYLLFEY